MELGAKALLLSERANIMLELINQHPYIFSIIVFLAFIGYMRSLYKFLNKRKK